MEYFFRPVHACVAEIGCISHSNRYSSPLTPGRPTVPACGQESRGRRSDRATRIHCELRRILQKLVSAGYIFHAGIPATKTNVFWVCFTIRFETGNGIVVDEVGVPKNGPDGQFTAVQGSSTFPLADGTIQKTTYIADENGYQAFGDHLPTPPPVNPIILRALDWLASLPSTQAPPESAYKN